VCIGMCVCVCVHLFMYTYNLYNGLKLHRFLLGITSHLTQDNNNYVCVDSITVVTENYYSFIF